MHGGLPPASVFPLSSLSFTCVDPISAAKQLTGASEIPVAPPITSSECKNGASGSTDGTLRLTIDDPAAMAAMQQYNLDFYGHPELRAWLLELTYRIHKPAREDLGVLLAAGCSGCLDKIIRMLVQEGESILVEESMFSGVRCHSENSGEHVFRGCQCVWGCNVSKHSIRSNRYLPCQSKLSCHNSR